MKQSDKLFSRRFVLNAGAGAIVAAAAPTASQAQSLSIKSDINALDLGRSKTTPLGLYLSPTAAHRALSENSEILFVDVRDPIEIMFVGHPSGLTKIIPMRIASHKIDAKSGQYIMSENLSFVSDFDALLEEKGKLKTDPIFVTCRSGSRSAAAARHLINAGYTNVWNLTEGFEGDKSPDGSRSSNGWRNADLPWAYKLEAGVAWGA